MRNFLLLLMATVFAFLLVACDEASVEKVESDGEAEASAAEAEDVEATDEAEEAEEVEAQNEDLTIGDKVNFDGLEITLNEVRIEPGGDFDEPMEEQFIVANMTIENTTDEEQAVSSMMNIELKDSEGYAYSTTILMEGTRGQLDGSIEPGGTMRGEIPFDVPVSEAYELHFSDPFKSGKAIWSISSDEL